MFSFFKNLFRRNGAVYDAQKKKLEEGSGKDRALLAAAADTHPEILYYLARDKDAQVRQAVAVNRATPVQAAALLARDGSVDVRVALAARLVELLPDLSADRHSQLYAYVVQALGALAQDEVLKIRRALSSALKDHAFAPPQVAAKLARDVEREVSEPVLRFCAALSDDDLLDILSGHPEPWVLSAVAGRPEVNVPVADALVDTRDVPANTVLISNSGAHYSPDALRKIVDMARDYPEWHAPIAARRELSVELARELAGFVGESVLALLEKRADFEEGMRREIAALVQRRMAYGSAGKEPPEARVERYMKAGALTAEVIDDALVWQDTRFVILALAAHARVHPVVAEKMLRAGAPRPVIALCWRAGMPMRLAVELQKKLSQIQPRDIVYARGGTDYPLTPAEIKWQLEFFGLDPGGS